MGCWGRKWAGEQCLDVYLARWLHCLFIFLGWAFPIGNQLVCTGADRTFPEINSCRNYSWDRWLMISVEMKTDLWAFQWANFSSAVDTEARKEVGARDGRKKFFSEQWELVSEKLPSTAWFVEICWIILEIRVICVFVNKNFSFFLSVGLTG